MEYRYKYFSSKVSVVIKALQLHFLVHYVPKSLTASGMKLVLSLEVLHVMLLSLLPEGVGQSVLGEWGPS